MRQTPVNDYLEEISTELPEELYGSLSDAIYETVCEFDEEVAQLKAENAKLRELCFGLAQVVKNDDDTFRRLRKIAKQELSYDFIGMYDSSLGKIDQIARFIDSMAELGVEVR